MNTYILRYISGIDEGDVIHYGYKKIETTKTKNELVQEFNDLLDFSSKSWKPGIQDPTFYGLSISFYCDFFDINYVSAPDKIHPNMVKKVGVSVKKYFTNNEEYDEEYGDDRCLLIYTLDEFLESIK